MNEVGTTQLSAAYRYCRQLNAKHGKTFFLATALLPASKRPHVHALYGFARFADDLVDLPMAGRSAAARLTELRNDVERAMAGRGAEHPVVQALADTFRRFDIKPSYVEDFLDSMASDLTITRYATFTELRRYMWGSASVIGLQLLPILGVRGEPIKAERYASDLGTAFQLTNFIRDIAEDYRRGRIYLPQDSLIEHGVSESMLSEASATPQVKGLVKAEVERARSFYRCAEPGISLLQPGAQECVRIAFTLYSEILTEVERADYDVLGQRAMVSLARRARVGSVGYLQSLRSRRSDLR